MLANSCFVEISVGSYLDSKLMFDISCIIDSVFASVTKVFELISVLGRSGSFLHLFQCDQRLKTEISQCQILITL